VHLDDWDKKFIRENLFMPFGSLVNGYCNLHKGEGITDEEFRKKMNWLFNMARGYSNFAFNRFAKLLKKLQQDAEAEVIQEEEAFVDAGLDEQDNFSEEDTK